MLKKILTILFVALLLISTVGCSKASTPEVTAIGVSVAIVDDEDKISEPIEMNLATCWAAPQFMCNLPVTYIKERAAALSDGKIRVIEHFGTIGAERELIEGVQISSIEGAVVTTGPLGSFIPLAELFMIPYLFNDWGHAYAAVDGALGDRLDELAAEQNMHILGWYSCGTRNIVGLGDPVITPDDLKGKKIRIMESRFLAEAYSYYGAIATPMSFAECFQALQQGAIDGEQTTLSVIGAGYGDVVDWATEVNEIYQLVPIMVNLDWWNSLPQEARNIIEQAVVESEAAQRQYAFKYMPDEAQKWVDAGLAFNVADREAFKTKALEIYPQFEEMLGDTEGWMDWVIALGEAYPFTFPGDAVGIEISWG
ncbi:MAG: TRAP transporter substrate-binding protein [Christensenellales bacterium]|jgi:TRAP-type C4-dicarboxylate transport system substrate-binding protein